MIPLLARPFAEYSPAEFKAHVLSLYVAPPVALPPPDYSVRLNKKGNPVLTVRREPKWLTSDEAGTIAQELGWTLQATWLMIIKRKIELRSPECRSSRKRSVESSENSSSQVR